MRILAIDQGTTSTRGIVFGADGSRALVHVREHRQYYPQPGWVEHDPLELLAAVSDAARAAAALAPVAVGIANQGESCLAWDADTGEPVSRVLVWQDMRTAGRIADLRAEGCEPEAQARSGLPLDAYFSAAKLGWIVDHIPAARDLLRAGRLRLGTTDAFFLHRLTGRAVTDVTTASRTGLMNLATCRWDAELCRMHGVPIEALPPIVPTTGDFGRMWAGGVNLALGASATDQQAALYGHGCRVAGDAKITLGTGAFALVLTGGLHRPATGPLPTVAWQIGTAPPVYALDGGVLAASAAVNWTRALGLPCGQDAGTDRDGRWLAEAGPVFVPALAGLGCPHWDREARGAWLGLDLATDTAALGRAVLEGVALRTAEVLDAIRAAVPVAETLSVDGGMSANRAFLHMLATATGCRLRPSREAELTAFGIADLAGGEVAVTLPRPAPADPVEPGPPPLRARDRFARAVRAVRDFGRPA